MTTSIRLAPSGPDIANGEGGLLEFGPGARLRLAQQATQVDITQNAITTAELVIGAQIAADPNPQQLVVSLATPDPNKNYAARVRCDVFSTLTNANVNLTLKLEVSNDGGTVWDVLANNEHVVSPAVAGVAAPDGQHATAGGFRQIELTRPLATGGEFGIDAGQATVKVRATIQGDRVGAFVDSRNVPSGNFGTVLLELEESF